MTELQQQQWEEREALQSIYEGDDNFKEVTNTTYQYKYGEEDNCKSFLVEIKWGVSYPTELPIINLEAFYNRNLMHDIKERIHSLIQKEAEQWIGCAMTYTLFECLKDHIEELTAPQPDTIAVHSVEDIGINAIKISDSTDTVKKKEPRREHLSKSQKRRQRERTDHKGDHPRGWDWVDIVKHLSQTGVKGDHALCISMATV